MVRRSEIGVSRSVKPSLRGLGGCLLLLVVAACSPTKNAASVPPPSRPHVFVIVMENKSPAEALRTRYVSSLAQRYAVLTNYHAVAHPSLPNYLALTSGNTWGIRDDGFHRLPSGGLGAQLTKSGISWRAYMEGMSEDCLADVGAYSVKHNPFAYYGAACPPNIVNFDQLSADLATNPPQFLWIGPDMCHDTHDCSLQTGDAWLASTVPQILASDAWKQNGVLFVVWDEDDNSSDSNAVSALVIAPHLKARASAKLYDHYSTLATVQDLLGVPRLGNASRAAAIDLAMAKG